MIDRMIRLIFKHLKNKELAKNLKKFICKLFHEEDIKSKLQKDI